MIPVSFDDLRGRRLLVLGDVNTGKTTLCARLLAEACAQGLAVRSAVLDLAPTIPEELAQRHGLHGVGGRLAAPDGVLVWHPRLAPPRLSSASEIEAQRKAADNAALIDTLLQQLPMSGRDILFVNDVTLYLQAGDALRLLACVDAASITTLVVNGYAGQRLGGGALTQRESQQTALLHQAFERHGRVLTLTQRWR